MPFPDLKELKLLFFSSVKKANTPVTIVPISPINLTGGPEQKSIFPKYSELILSSIPYSVLTE